MIQNLIFGVPFGKYYFLCTPLYLLSNFLAGSLKPTKTSEKDHSANEYSRHYSG